MSGSQEVTADAKQVLDRAVDGRDALELPCGVEAAHLPFALSRRFVRDLGSVVGVSVRAVADRGDHRAAGGFIAGQLGYSGRAKMNRLLLALGRSSGVRSRKRPKPVLIATYWRPSTA